jgi:hypothetical protein
MYYLIPYFLKKKYDAMNMLTIDIPVEPLHDYMNKKRKEGRNVSHLALIITAYLKTVAEFPAINRFIVNKKVYQHNDLTVSMVVLRPESNDDTMSKITLNTQLLYLTTGKDKSYICENRRQQIKYADKVMKIILHLSFQIPCHRLC